MQTGNGRNALPKPFERPRRHLAGLARWSAAGVFLFLLFGIVLRPLDAAFTAYLVTVMAAITVSDFRQFIVPDILALPAILIGTLANSLVMHDAVMAGIQESLLGIAIAGITFYLIRVGFYWLRGIEGLGMGDVKLAAVAGAWIGPTLLPETCLAATVAALAFILAVKLISGGKLSPGLKIPFGSFIAPAIIAAWAFRLWEAGAFVS